MAREPWEAGSTTETPRTREPWELGPNIDPRDSSLTGRVETLPERTERLDLERQYQEMGPGRRFRAGVSNMLSGVPIIRNIPGIGGLSTPEDIDIARRARPGLSTIERATTGTAAYMPAARGAQLGGVALRNALTRNRSPNLGLAGELSTQGTLGASVALADRPPRNAEEAILNGIFGLGSGVAGPLGSRLLGPSGTGNRLTYNARTDSFNDPRELRHIVSQIGLPKLRRIIYDAHATTLVNPRVNFEREVIRLLNQERGRRLSERTGGFITRVGPAAVGFGVGHSMGGIPGAIYGAVAGEVGRGVVRGFTGTPMGRRYLGRQVTPGIAALLNSIGPVSFSNIDEPRNTLTGR